MGKIKMELKGGPLPILGAYPIIMVGANESANRLLIRDAVMPMCPGISLWNLRSV